MVAARGSLVDAPLDDGADGGGDGGDEETEAQAADTAEADAVLAEEGVDAVVDDGDGDDDGERVEVGDEIIGGAVGGHGGGLRGRDTADTAVVEVVDGEEEEDLTGGEGTGDIVDETVGPGDGLVAVGGDALFREDGRLRRVPEAVAAHALETAALEGHADDLEDVRQDGAIGRDLDGALVEHGENAGHHHVQDTRNQEGEPVSHVFLRVGGGDGEESTDVDEAVEDEENALHRRLGVDDDGFTRIQRLEVRLLLGVLIEDGRGNVTLEHTRAKRQHQHGNDERRNGVASLEN